MSGTWIGRQINDDLVEIYIDDKLIGCTTRKRRAWRAYPIDDGSEDGYGRFYTVKEAGDSLARRAQASEK